MLMDKKPGVNNEVTSSGIVDQQGLISLTKLHTIENFLVVLQNITVICSEDSTYLSHKT